MKLLPQGNPLFDYLCTSQVWLPHDQLLLRFKIPRSFQYCRSRLRTTGTESGDTEHRVRAMEFSSASLYFREGDKPLNLCELLHHLGCVRDPGNRARGESSPPDTSHRPVSLREREKGSRSCLKLCSSPGMTSPFLGANIRVRTCPVRVAGFIL